MPGYLRVVPMLACMGIIFFLSHQPGDDLDLSLFPNSDKLAHLAVYAVLSGTVIVAFSAGIRRSRRGLVFAAALVIPVLFGISDEYHQGFVVGRSSEVGDLVADSLGALLVSLFWFFKISENQKHNKIN